jgi:hypothetical protein
MARQSPGGPWAAVGAAVVQHVGRLVHLRADAVAHIVLEDAQRLARALPET